MLLAIYIVHSALVTVVFAVRCACSETTCNMDIENMDCYADYCYLYRDLPNMPVTAQGCITTRQEIPSNFSCEQNRKGGIFCVCQSDFCNTASLPSTPVTKIPTVMCIRSETAQASNFSCRGHFCQTRMEMVVNKYGDLEEGPTSRYCDDLYTTAKTSLRILASFADTDDTICTYQRAQSAATIQCYCRTDYCNNVPLPQIMMGNVTCYTWALGKFGYCKGQYCYQQVVRELSPIIGCLSVYSPSGTIMEEDSVAIRDGLNYFVCTEDLCNGFPMKASRTTSMPLLITFLLFYFSLINC